MQAYSHTEIGLQPQQSLDFLIILNVIMKVPENSAGKRDIVIVLE